MLRTNTKKVKDGVKAYIMENFDVYDGDDVNTNDFKSVAVYIWETFNDEILRHDRRRMSYQDFFIEWLQGLPTVLDCPHYFESAVDIVGDLLEQAENERNKYTETDAEHLMSYLIYREISAVIF